MSQNESSENEKAVEPLSEPLKGLQLELDFSELLKVEDFWRSTLLARGKPEIERR